jgi:hypothetical protein
MTLRSSVPAAWTFCRYRWLLPWSARSRSAARRYARLSGQIELRLDHARRARGGARIARALGCSAAAADRVFAASLVSEAQEEADTAWSMRRPRAWPQLLQTPADEPAPQGATIYVTLHFGSPVLAYLDLRRRRVADARLIVRALSPANPMPEAKRAFAARKVAWVASISGYEPLATDSAATARARDHLVAGGALFAAIDVPGDVVSRASAVTLFGERVLVSSGIVTLARLTGAAMQPIVAVRRGEALTLRYGARIPAGDDGETLTAVFRELASFIADDPGEWWLWPYVTPAPSCAT